MPFETLIPGHGAPMTRADFVQWKTAFNNMIKCGRSSVDIANVRRRLGARCGEVHL